MTFIEFLDLHFRLNTLTVFRAVLDDPAQSGEAAAMLDDLRADAAAVTAA